LKLSHYHGVGWTLLSAVFDLDLRSLCLRRTSGGARVHTFQTTSPDRFQQRGFADAFVSGNQRQAFSPRGSADEPVSWIVRVIIRKLRGQGRNFWSNRFDRDPFNESIHRALDGSVASNSSSSHQGSQFPERDGGNGEAIHLT